MIHVKINDDRSFAFDEVSEEIKSLDVVIKNHHSTINFNVIQFS